VKNGRLLPRAVTREWFKYENKLGDQMIKFIIELGYHKTSGFAIAVQIYSLSLPLALENN